jgi:Domain of unknown function (DUF5666)
MFVRTSAFMLWVVAIVAMPIAAARPLGGVEPQPITQQSEGKAPATKQLGAIKAIKGSTITLTTDAGTDVDLLVADTTRIVSVEPGQKDLKSAKPMQFSDLQVGDRILVLGRPSTDAKTFMPSSIIAMKHSDLEAKQQHERDEWQKHGIGGLVSAVDPAAGTVTIGVGSLGAATNVAVQTTKSTIIRRYAPDSVKFDDAKPGRLAEIKPGDQVRARGARSADGTTFAAEEIVTGAFRNIAGTISSIDAAANTVSVTDLITKQPVAVRISAESQIRKLPPEMAQRIAMRMKAGAAGGASGTPGGTAASGAQGQANAPNAPPNPSGQGGGNPAAAGGGRAPDLQQFLTRLPANTLADLQKGDAVMIVSTEGSASGQVTAITLLAGIEPLLTASPRGAQGMMLSPWSLGGGEGGGGGDSNP